ncbi:ABC transporter substrate-binding protein [Psychromonas arctica]|uniref:ABC transporter substrate-binding protein n=1 Tax=Psychromonas arctica TaxID=168275 RepID=UPI002FCFBFC9
MFLRWMLMVSMLYSVGSLAQSQNVFNPQAITVAIDKTPVSFNPFTDDSLMTQQFKHLLFDPLFRWDDQQHLQGRLVEHWERLDKTTVRFFLRENIHFHTGNLLTSKDVIWSFEQAKKQSSISFLSKLEWVKATQQFSFDIRSSLTDIELLDHLTNLFVLDSTFYQSNANLLDTSPSIILPPVKTPPMSGTGPYLIQQYNPMLGIVVVANPHYWDGEPETKYFRFMRINKPQSRLFALLADDVQVSFGVPNKTAEDLEENTIKNLVRVPSSNVIFLTINDKLSPILENEDARKAIHLAINHQGMLKYILKDNGQVHPSILSLAENTLVDGKSNPSKEIMPEYDLDKAKSLIKTMNVPKQMSLLVMLDEVGNTKKVAEALTKMLKRIGITVVTQEIDSKDIWKNTNLYYDFTVSTWDTRLMSRDNMFENLFLDSDLSDYLQDKFKQQGLNDNFKSQSDYFKSLQQNNWIIPLFYQDKIWAQNNKFNLKEIFSSNGIPYWSLFKVKKQIEITPKQEQ